MNDLKPGKQTTEFYLTMGLNAIIGILTALSLVGILTAEEQANYIKAAEAVFIGVGPVAMAIITAVYSHGRSNVKKAHLEVQGKQIEGQLLEMVAEQAKPIQVCGSPME